jgi:hypothetical protein
MSKRLRASMRAANRGRSLRPRASQVPPDPFAERDSALPAAEAAATTSEPPEAEAAQARSEPPEAPHDEGVEAAEAAPVEAPVAASSAARETVREPFVRKADEAPEAPEAPAAKAEAPEAPAAKVEAPEAALSDTHPSVESPLAREFAKLTAGTTPPVQEEVAAFKAEASPKEASPKIEAPASAPTMRTERGEEPKKVPAPKVEVVKARAEEPRKAAPARVEEPRKAAKAETPKPAAARAETPKPAAAKKAARPKVEEPESVKPASRRPLLEDEMDPSSISAEFFRKDVDSVPPVEEHEEAPLQPVLSPVTLARRARLRRLVAGVVGFASVISIAVIGKAVLAAKRTPTPVQQPVATAVQQQVREVEPPKEAVKPPVAEAPKPEVAKVDEPKKAEEPAAKADDKRAEEPAAKADDKKAEEPAAKAEEPAKPAADAVALKKETESLLNRGKNKEAIEKAREAIAADPTDAMPYLYLGSALQETGKWKDGIEAYCECVRNATKGPIHECRAMGGHK